MRHFFYSVIKLSCFLVLSFYTPNLVAAVMPSGVAFAQSNNIVIKRHDVYLNPNLVTQSTVYYNASPGEITYTMTLNLPVMPVNASGLDPTAGFEVSVNGKPVHYSEATYAVNADGLEVSQILNQLLLPTQPELAMQLLQPGFPGYEETLATLIKHKLIDLKTQKARWSLKTLYTWQQSFPGNTEVHVKQSYQPFMRDHIFNLGTKPNAEKQTADNTEINNPVTSTVSGGLTNFWHKIRRKKPIGASPKIATQKNIPTAKPQYDTLQLSQQLRDYCPQPHDMQQFSHTKKMNGYEMFFNLPQDLMKPIEKFSLSIESPQHMHAMLCWPFDFEQQSSGKMISFADNYLPNQDIHLLFYQDVVEKSINPNT